MAQVWRVFPWPAWGPGEALFLRGSRGNAAFGALFGPPRVEFTAPAGVCLYSVGKESPLAVVADSDNGRVEVRGHPGYCACCCYCALLFSCCSVVLIFVVVVVVVVVILRVSLSV